MAPGSGGGGGGMDLTTAPHFKIQVVALFHLGFHTLSGSDLSGRLGN